jgi:hypothetical protein
MTPRVITAVILCVLAAAWTITADQGARPTPFSQPKGHQQMVELLRQIAADARETNSIVGEGDARVGRAALAALPPSTPDSTRWSLLMRLADEELRLGRFDEAIARFREARQLLARSRQRFDPSVIAMNAYRLGVASMRWGEMQNCANNPAAASCILPLRGDAIHRLPEGSRQAIALFQEVLELVARDSPMHLGARWLLNIAFMTVGGYPDQVPTRYLIPPSAFESDVPFRHFENIAPRLGLDLFNQAGGAVADDFDGDGDLDLVISSMDPAAQVRFFRNEDGAFEERTEEAGLIGITGGLNMVQADYDNDGHVDLLVLRGGWMESQGQHPKSLLHNNGNGTFTDVTFTAGLGRVHRPTQVGVWADFDRDGDLDVYVGNESTAKLRAPSQLFRNNGNGTFTDIAADAGVGTVAWTKGAAWGDYDADGWPDLYVSNTQGPNYLFHNNRNGTFTDVASALGVVATHNSFGTWFWDVDNDGNLDLFVAAYAATIQDLAKVAIGQGSDAQTLKLYRGIGGGRFIDATREYALDRPNAPMGANFGDLDGDGYLDFYLGTGYPDYPNLMPNVMYLNQRGARFADVSTAGGFAHLQKGHAVVFADFDQDGAMDVFEQMGGAYPGDKAFNVLYHNPGPIRRWLGVQLVGVQSNRSAIGARIRADFVDGHQRSVYRYVGSGGSFGGNPLRQTLGLGQASVVDRLEIVWPATGKRQTFQNVPIDRAIRIVEGETSYSMLPLKRLTLTGRRAAPRHEH